MKIKISGAGNTGTGLGKRRAAKDHDVVVSFARDPAKLKEAATVMGDGACAGTPHDAVSHIVWDATHSLKPDMSGLALLRHAVRGDVP